jgi:hypothetical protein
MKHELNKKFKLTILIRGNKVKYIFLFILSSCNAWRNVAVQESSEISFYSNPNSIRSYASLWIIIKKNGLFAGHITVLWSIHYFFFIFTLDGGEWSYYIILDAREEKSERIEWMEMYNKKNEMKSNNKENDD